MNSALTAALAAALVLGCSARSVAPDPAAAFDELVEASGSGGAAALEARLSTTSHRMLSEYQERARALHASNLPANPTEVLAAQLAAGAPRACGQSLVGADSAWVEIVYRGGTPGRLRFVREDGAWRFDLAREMESVMEQLREAEEVLEIYGAARREGRPAERIFGDDDD